MNRKRIIDLAIACVTLAIFGITWLRPEESGRNQTILWASGGGSVFFFILALMDSCTVTWKKTPRKGMEAVMFAQAPPVCGCLVCLSGPGRGEGSTPLYLNEAEDCTSAALDSCDVTGMGESKFMFVPFCGEKFRWEGKDGRCNDFFDSKYRGVEKMAKKMKIILVCGIAIMYLMVYGLLPEEVMAAPLPFL